VTRLPDWAALRQGNRKKITARTKDILDRMLSPLNAMRGIDSGQDYKPPLSGLGIAIVPGTRRVLRWETQ
jgi:hypothetical protein